MSEPIQGYNPKVYEAALKNREKIKEIDKKGEVHEKMPRLYHRPDIRKHIKKDGWQGDYIKCGYANPGRTSIIHNVFEVLLQTMKADKLNGWGVLNFEADVRWNKGQLITWGPVVENGKFAALYGDPWVSPWISMYDLRDLVKACTAPEDWEQFSQKESGKYADMVPQHCKPELLKAVMDDIAAHKIMDNIATMQRCSFDTANCYGAAVYQFDMALDTRYQDDLDTMEVRLVIGRRVPIIESKRAAAARLKPQKSQVDEKTTHLDKVVDVPDVLEEDSGASAVDLDVVDKF